MYKYKCTECGQVYDELLEYCDCGNDSFDVIEEEPARISNAQSQNNARTYENASVPDSRNSRFDLPSVAFLVVCIVLSFVILFFVGNPSSDDSKDTAKNNNTPKQEKKNTAKNIPSIDELWIANKTPAPVTVKNEEPKKQPAQTVQEAVSALFKPSANSNSNSNSNSKTVYAPKTTQSTTYTPSVKSSTKTVYKPASQPAKISSKPAQKASKPAAQAKKTQTVTKNVPAQPVKQTTVKKTTTQQASTQSSVSRSTHTQTVQKSAANAAAQKQALLNYKIALRNKIASNINFGRIVGDGSCTISFKISSSGALTNRQFAKLSSNDSLNDAVYNGVMQTPAYNPPPSGYKNETLRLTVKMYGGNFEVDLN